VKRSFQLISTEQHLFPAAEASSEEATEKVSAQPFLARLSAELLVMRTPGATRCGRKSCDNFFLSLGQGVGSRVNRIPAHFSLQVASCAAVEIQPKASFHP